MKDLSFIKLFFGIRIIYNCINRKIYFDQNEYIKKILDKFGYSDLNGVKILWPANIKLLRTWDPMPGNIEDYVRKITTINFLVINMRQAIQYTVNRFTEGDISLSKEYFI